MQFSGFLLAMKNAQGVLRVASVQPRDCRGRKQGACRAWGSVKRIGASSLTDHYIDRIAVFGVIMNLDDAGKCSQVVPD